MAKKKSINSMTPEELRKLADQKEQQAYDDKWNNPIKTAVVKKDIYKIDYEHCRSVGAKFCGGIYTEEQINSILDNLRNLIIKKGDILSYIEDEGWFDENEYIYGLSDEEIKDFI